MCPVQNTFYQEVRKKTLSNTRTQILIILFTMSNIDYFLIAQQVIILQINWPVARSDNTIFSNDH